MEGGLDSDHFVEVLPAENPVDLNPESSPGSIDRIFLSIFVQVSLILYCSLPQLNSIINNVVASTRGFSWHASCRVY